MINKLSGVLVNNTDNLIITYFSGLVTVGLCSNYNLLINIINTTLKQFFDGIQASLGNLNAVESREKRELYFDITNFINFWIFGFCTICIILLVDDVIKLWIGDKYILDNSIKYILAINFYIVGMQNSVWSYKVTSGIFKNGRFILAIMAIINLALSIILGNKMGLFGVLFATTIARITTNVWYDPYIVYKLIFNKSAKIYFIKYIENIIIIIVTIFITNYVISCINMDINLYIQFIFKLIGCILIPNICFFIIFYKNKDFKFIKKYFFYILKNKGLLKIRQM